MTKQQLLIRQTSSTYVVNIYLLVTRTAKHHIVCHPVHIFTPMMRATLAPTGELGTRLDCFESSEVMRPNKTSQKLSVLT